VLESLVSDVPKDVSTDQLRTSVRFPLHIEIVLTTGEREYRAVTEDVSANGVSFSADDLPPLNAAVEFRMIMPAAMMGGREDVQLHCVGRIVRRESVADRITAAAVIDNYHLKG
jgi:hypothetical protein